MHHEIGQFIAVAITARNEERHYVVRQFRDRRQDRAGWRFIEVSGIMDRQAVRKCDKARRNVETGHAIAEAIEIGRRGERGIGCDDIRRTQLSLPRRMNIELKEHLRLSRTSECEVKACVNEDRKAFCL
jgi:hypothetical protein